MEENKETQPTTETPAIEAPSSLLDIDNQVVFELMMAIASDQTEPTLEHLKHLETIEQALCRAYGLKDYRRVCKLFDGKQRHDLPDIKVRFTPSLEIADALDAMALVMATTKTPAGGALFSGYQRLAMRAMAKEARALLGN